MRRRSSRAAGFFAGDIERVGGHTEEKRRLVLLVRRREEPHESCRAAAGERQHARGQRIERARMADPLFAKQPARRDNNVMRCQAFRLVDDDDTVHPCREVLRRFGVRGRYLLE